MGGWGHEHLRRLSKSRLAVVSVGAEPSPALLVPSTKRRGRKSSKEVPESKEADSPTAEEPVSKSRGRGRKPKPKPGNSNMRFKLNGSSRFLASFSNILSSNQRLEQSGSSSVKTV